jgi:SM-20-related protein
MTGPFRITGFLDDATCGAVIAELRAANGRAATVTGREPAAAVDPRVRRVTRLTVTPPLQARIVGELVERKDEIGERFGVALSTCEDPQFLRYGPGDHFVAHQDGNTPLVYDDTRFRKVSVVIFLSPRSAEPSPGAYGGGDLVLYGPVSAPQAPRAVDPEPGMLVAFPSETTHEVTPVTHGERYTIVSWYR